MINLQVPEDFFTKAVDPDEVIVIDPDEVIAIYRGQRDE
jgi:hypothetical protein